MLSIDVGGTHVKLLATGQDEPREFVSGPKLTPRQMVDARSRKLARGWKYDVVSIGYPGVVTHGASNLGTAQSGVRLGGFQFRKGVRRAGEGHQ